MNPEAIKILLKEHKIRPSKRLGQNFLVDDNILKKIIDASNISPQDTILEIGPGLGILTLELAKRAKKVIAIEKDRKMCEILKKTAKDYKNLEIINADILTTNYKIQNTCLAGSPRCEAGRQANYKVIANLPYYITSPVIRKFLESENKPKLMVLMVQKEVAQRIVAKPPRMNLLAVAVQFYAEPKIINYVSKNSFWPQPRVDSAIIKIIPRPTKQGEYFFNLVKAGFSSKRKMLKNNLKIEKNILKKLGLNPKIRAENLSIEEWLKLYDEIYKK